MIPLPDALSLFEMIASIEDRLERMGADLAEAQRELRSIRGLLPKSCALEGIPLQDWFFEGG